MITASASKSWAQNSTISTPVPNETIDLAKKAADEVEASRALIVTQAVEITSLKENSALKDEKISLLQSIVDLKTQQLAEKEKVIAAANSQVEILTKQNAKLEKSNKRLRKIGLVLGAAVAGLVLFH